MKSLKQLTHGVLFFGTPHRGASGMQWGLLRLKILSAIQPTNDRLIRHLTSDSEYLQEQLYSFSNIASHFQTAFFYETIPRQIAPGLRILVC
jgi:hypothetical protein